MDASCAIQDDIHGFRLVYKYVSRILGTYHASISVGLFIILRNVVKILWYDLVWDSQKFVEANLPQQSSPYP